MLAALLLSAAEPDLSSAASQQVARDECRGSTDTDVVVCGNRQRTNRYQVTPKDAPWDWTGQTRGVLRERWNWAEGGEFGIGSCGPVGPGGGSGCAVKEWRRKRQQKRGW